MLKKYFKKSFLFRVPNYKFSAKPKSDFLINIDSYTNKNSVDSQVKNAIKDSQPSQKTEKEILKEAIQQEVKTFENDILQSGFYLLKIFKYFIINRKYIKKI